MTKKKICLLVSNDLTHDPRVEKQAESLSKIGYEVKVLAWMSYETAQTLESESNGKFQVLRGVFMAHWNKRSHFLLNLKLSKYNFTSSLSVIFFPLVKIKSIIFSPVQKIFKILRPYLVIIYRIWKSCVKRLKKSPVVTLETSAKTVDQSSPNSNKIEKPKQPAKLSFAQSMAVSQFYLNYFFQMSRFMTKEGIEFCPDAVHANDLDTLWAGWQIKKKTGAKLIYDAHEIWTEQGLQLPKIVLNSYSLLERFLFRKVDYFITVNESIAQELKKRYGIKKIPTEIVYNSPRLQRNNFMPASEKEIKVLYQGRYSVDRGLEELALASKYFKKNIKLYFRGTGSEDIQLKIKQMVEKAGLGQKVVFLPPVPMKDMIKEARSFDIGVIAYIPKNINNLFCLPNKIYEYMMAGLALAVANLPELKKVVSQSENGMTFDPYNPKDIARKINSLASNLDRLNKFKNNSLTAAKVNNWNNEEEKLKLIYERITD